jgi:tetratricopeptide (TPR) repeat protein
VSSISTAATCRRRTSSTIASSSTPPERNSVYGYALYKSAWAFYNLEDFRGSLQRFAEVIEFATQNPNAFDGQNLARQARRELVQPYARVGTPERALEFFGRYATNRDQSLEMLESLAELYYDTGQWDKTITTYHKLMAESPNSDKLCVWESKVAHAVIAQGNKRATVEELRRLVQIYEGFVGQTNRPEAARNECKAGTAGVLFQLATSWHIESVGNCRTEDERGCSQGTQDRETMGKAAELYELLLRQFPDMERLQFPDIQRDSWPSRYRIAYYMADLSYRAEQWERCGPAFEAVIELNPTGEFTNDAAHSAVLCYNRLYNTTLEGNEGRVRQAAAPGAAGTDAQSAAVARREMTTTEAGMLRAFSNYVLRGDRCFGAPAADQVPPRAHLLRDEPVRGSRAPVPGDRVHAQGHRVRHPCGEPLPRLAQHPRDASCAEQSRVSRGLRERARPVQRDVLLDARGRSAK